jgi:hypothetical protein
MRDTSLYPYANANMEDLDMLFKQTINTKSDGSIEEMSSISIPTKQEKTLTNKCEI